MPAESEDHDGDVLIHAILQGLGLITNKEAENLSDEDDMWRKASDGSDASILNAPSNGEQGSPHIGLVRSAMTSPTDASNNYHDQVHQAEQISGYPEQMHSIDGSCLVPTTGWIAELTVVNQSGVDDGTRPVNIFLPAWPGSFTAAAGSYDYSYTY